MKKIIATAAALVAISANAAPVMFDIDPHHTYPKFSYSHFGYSTQLSKFNRTEGSVVLDAKKETGSVDVSIDVSSVDSGYDTFNEHLMGEDFFDAAKHPKATFKSSKVLFKDGKPSAVEGALTIKGITKDVVLEVTSFQEMPHPMMKKDAIGANAFVVVKRSDFGMSKYVPYVGDDVRIDISIEAIAK